MVRRSKVLARMRQNPRNWRIEDLQSLADSLKITWDHDATSHVVFKSPTGAHLSIPAARPLKPIYIRKFLALVDQVMKEKDQK